MNLSSRAKNIITIPKIEWEKVALEPETPQTVITQYVLPLAGIAAVCTFIGYSFVGGVRTINFGLLMAVQLLITQVIGVLITAYVIDALAATFNSQRSFSRSVQLVAYGYTPALVGAFLNILPGIAWLGSIFGLYGLYLMYLGLGPIKRTPDDKKIVYLVVTIVAVVVVYLVIGAVLGSLLLGGYRAQTPQQ